LRDCVFFTVRLWFCFVPQTAQQFTTELNSILLKANMSNPSLVTGYPEAPLAYDAVWALAFALNKTAVRYLFIYFIY
jgi:hypothetical protein